MPRTPSLLTNIGSLYAVQAASYAAPLITLPWLTHVLGPAGFGRLSFCVAVTSYFVLFADYGFNFTATRQIALHSTDRPARSRIFWNTIAVKAALACAGFPILLLLTLAAHRLGEERSLLAISYLTVVGSVLTPTWYFQGTERQTVLSGLTVAVRLASIPLTFLMVRSSGDVRIAALIASGAPVVAGSLCLLYLLRDGQLEAMRINRREFLETLKDGWHLFVSSASISLYQATNTVVLGFVSGSAAVGHYSAAEKITQAAQGLLTPINQSVYPRVSRLMNESRPAAFALIHKVLWIQGSIALALSLLLFAAAPVLIRTLFGPAYEQTIDVLRWLAFLPFLVGLSNVFGVHTMLAMGMKKAVSYILVTAGAINVFALFILTHRFSAVGAAMSVVATEFFVTAVMFLTLKNRNVPVFRVPVAT